MKNRPKFKFVIILLITLAAIIGMYCSYLFIRNAYYEKQLAHVLEKLNACEPGWDWESRFARLPKLTKEENAGEEVKAIMRLLTLDEYRSKLGVNEWSAGFNVYENSRLGEAQREFLRDHPNAQLPKWHRDTIASIVSGNPCPEALQRARNLKQFQSALLPHVYRPFLSLSALPDVQSVRNLARLLSWNVSLQLQDNKLEEAASDIGTMLQLARLYEHDPFLICTLVRSAIVQSACHAAHHLLAQSPDIPLPLIKRLQEAFEQEETSMISVPDIFRWERALHDHDLKLLHSGEYSLSQFLELHGNMFVRRATITRWLWLDDLLKKFYPAIVLGLWAEPKHFAVERADLLKFYDRVIAWSSLPEHQLLSGFNAMSEQGPGVSPFIYRMQYTGTKEEYLKNSFMRYDQIARAMLTHRAHCRCIAMALAAERFRLEKGFWPESWEKLAPEYFKNPLLDPFTGKPLLFKRLSDGLMIYSVGVNQIDDGGSIFPIGKQFYNDIGYRLWDPPQRRMDMRRELKAIEDEINPQGQ